ncbi:nucleobindin-2 isoform X2 [Euwallacea fornicatus]|uniref:nucleobindin-2 isoform X2 n=1 Tax=Euwallacea fornicatus TaxID=995702 RepID=UPI00338E651C
MQTKFAVLLFTSLLQTCFAPPVTQNVKENESPPDSGYGGLEDYMEYHRYLKEVVNALESDPDFRQKLEKADEKEIKSGKIADELQFVSHHVRSRLDEIKRVELQRLRALVEMKLQLEGNGNSIDEDPTHHHLDHSNPHTFEIEDLKKLIKQTTQDLAEADKMRREEFKHYELEKEYQKQEKLNHTNGNERDKLEHEFQEMEQKHKKHEKLHEPGHKAQLEEVWEEQDQMQQEFDPKTFFMLHDIDGNELWDQEEVKALFIKELDKMYQQGAPEDDMRERFEEMERMRESVFNEMDTNSDGFIDFREFLRQTKSNNFKQDHGWQGLDEQTKPYSDEELQEYIRQHHAVNQMPQAGYVPMQQLQHPAGYVQQAPSGAYQVPPRGYQQVPSHQQFQAGQMPQMPPQPLDLNTNEIHSGQPLQHQQQQPPQYQQQPPQYQQSPQLSPQYQQSPPQAHQVPQTNAQKQPPNPQVNIDPPIVEHQPQQNAMPQQANVQKQV